jgi:SSS family solute:Na+ symporter
MFAFYGQHYAPETAMRGDVALFHFVANHLPPVVSGLFLAACLGAIMSTLDAGFHSLATVVTKDIYARHWRKGAGDKAQLRFSKICLAAIGLFAIGVALMMAMAADNIADSFMETMVFWISFQGILAILFLLGATSCRVTASDVLRAFAAGCIVTVVMVVWYLQSRTTGQPISFLFVSVPGEVAMIIAGFLPAFWRKKLPPEKIQGLTLWTLDHADKK